MACSHFNLKHYCIRFTISHLDACNFMEHAHPSYAYVIIWMSFINWIKFEPNFHAHQNDETLPKIYKSKAPNKGGKQGTKRKGPWPNQKTKTPNQGGKKEEWQKIKYLPLISRSMSKKERGCTLEITPILEKPSLTKMWVYSCATWKPTSLTIDANASHMASWDATLSLPWKQQKRWIPMESKGWPHM